MTCMWLSDFNKRHLLKQGLLWTDFFVAILKNIEADQFSLMTFHLTYFVSRGISTPTAADTLCIFHVILFMTYNATDFMRYQITLAEYKFMFSHV